jgi:flagellin-like protein
MKNIKAKAISPIVATILLIVVAVILVTIVLSWGKEFSTKSVSTTNSLVNYDILSDKQSFLRFVDSKNGMYTFDYYPPNTGNVNFKVVGYSLIGYNDYIPLEPEKEITHAGKFMLPLGIINEQPITISLLLEDGSYLTFKNIKNTNRAPSQSDCPTGFVPVPGNHLYGTVGNKGGFCVAKYEMKVDQNGDGLGDANTACQYSSYGTWDNAKATCGYTLSGRTIVSSASGYPLVDINQTDSQLACTSIGGHLITNEEWMTIARNIEIVSSNWSSSIVGTGYIYSGHNDGTPNAALAADTNDSNGYYLTGQIIGDNQRRTLTLTNGQVIWDLAGNVYDWVGTTISSDDLSPAYDDDENLGNDGEYSTYFLTADNNFGSIGYKGNFLLNSDYNSDNGIGRTWGCTTNCNGEEYTIAFLRGGVWDYVTTAGVLFLYAYNSPSTTYSYIGFRCVVVPE